MTQRIVLRTVQAHEFRPPQQGVITNAIVPASELIENRSLKFGFAPNLRVANKNKKTAVIESILKSIATEKAVHIDSPVRLTCRYSSISEGEIEMILDPEMDGIMDGGHRCRAIELASINGLSLDQVTIQLQVFSGLENSGLRKKAIQSNTSRSVSARARQYFSGAYDELIDKIDMSKYPACFWRDGEALDSTGIFSSGLHAVMLLSWVSPDMYDRSGGGANPYTRAKGIGVGNEKNTFTMAHLLKVAHLFDDIFQMEKAAITALLNHPKFVTFVRMTPTAGRNVSFRYPSKLLDGTEIQARLPGAIAGPIIYPVRKMLTRDYQWQYPPKMWVSKWVRHGVSKYIDRLQRLGGGEEIAIATLLQGTPVVWRDMDTTFNKWRDTSRIADLY